MSKGNVIKTCTAAFLLTGASVGAWAQSASPLPPPSDQTQFLSRAVGALQQQRNEAQHRVAQLAAQNAGLQAQVQQLQAENDALKKQNAPKAEEPAKSEEPAK